MKQDTFNAAQFDRYHMGRIKRHYLHAREKHPHFCDWLRPDADSPYDAERIADGLSSARTRIADATSRRSVGWDDLLDCEVWEELYDAVAVLLRVIDVLEGRQPLVKPETKGEADGSK